MKWHHSICSLEVYCGLEVSQTRGQETCQEVNAVIQVKVLKAGIKVEAAHTEPESLTLGD